MTNTQDYAELMAAASAKLAKLTAENGKLRAAIVKAVARCECGGSGFVVNAAYQKSDCRQCADLRAVIAPERM